MSEQISRRSNNVTSAPFETPFETAIVRFGQGGLNLKDSLDALEGWSRLTNLSYEDEKQATARPGETALATHGSGVSCHSIRKLRNPYTGGVTRFWGVGGTLHRGLSGATSQISSGYSGDPLTFCPHRAKLGADAWMFVADQHRMQKIRWDGLALPIGLGPPTAPPGTDYGNEYSSALVLTAGGGTDTSASNWTPAPGRDKNGQPTGTPAAAVDDFVPSGAPAIYLTPNPVSGVAGPYDSWWGCPVSRDLTVLHEVGGSGQTRPADDNDIMHLEMKMAQPWQIAELRVYVVVSENFDATQLPGAEPVPTDGSDAPTFVNTDAYVKAFRPNDYIQFVTGAQTQAEAAETARIYALRDQDAHSRAYNDTRPSANEFQAQSDPNRAPSFQLGLGSHQWFSYGLLGSPLRRGDFQRIGSTPGRDWSTITGVIIYMRTAVEGATSIAFGDMYLTGGFGPDTSEPGLQQYDYRCTNYDPRDGCESNGSPIQDPSAFLDPLRRQVIISPPGSGTAALHQRVYRRGSTLNDDWYFVGENDRDGGQIVDRHSDTEIALAGTMPTDHFAAVPSLDSNGNTIPGQPVAAIFGPIEGMLMACGDPHRPGYLYYSLPDEPDHWSAFGNVEVCPPSEELLHGGLLGHQGFVFSRARLYFIYPNLGGAQGVTCTPTLCTRGPLSRWAWCTGPAGMIFFVADDGIFATDGGPEQWLTEAINALFIGAPTNDLTPIDKTATLALRLTVWENKLYFQYQDLGGNRQLLVYSIVYKAWRHYELARFPATVQGLDEEVLLIGGLSTGASYTHTGTSDDGDAIHCTIRTGSISGGRREEKLYGDLVLDAAPNGVDLSVQVFLNEETASNAQVPISGSGLYLLGRKRFLVDAFGASPQKAHSIACELRWAATGPPPTLYQLGVSLTPQPDLTNTRVTNWDDLNSPDEVWLTGLTLDCDTGGATKTIFIERDFQGSRDLVASFDVTSANRHKFKFSWPAVSANMVRIRPDPADCAPWLLYRADWIYVSEPPRISQWDIHFENRWDQYYTGLDLYCDTFSLEKQIEVWVDGNRLVNTLAGGLTYWPVVTTGRQVVHLTLPWGRGHVFRFLAIDHNPGLLYTHRWQLEAEPSEQANWNQNFSILGTHADKWLKAIIFECDTYGVNKTVNVEVDGVVVEILTVNTTGRKVVQVALPQQHLGRVWRMFPTDGNPGRLYTAEPIFDEEPFCFNRWETQETNHRLAGWFYPLYGHITVKSTADVTLTVTLHHNQVGGTTTTNYTIPATGGQKQRRFLNGFLAGKGVLIKYLLTSAQPFFLYRDETTVVIQPWGAYDSIVVQPFGNDDMDAARPMSHAILAAHSSGGAIAPGATA